MIGKDLSTKQLLDLADKPEDMRMKKCKICGKTNSIHKFDCYCNNCKAIADKIRQNNCYLP